VQQVFCCAGPYFALERWTAASAAPLRRSFVTGQILSNVGAPVRLRAGDWRGTLDRASTLLLPAALGAVEIEGPADVLFGYLPDLEADVLAPLLAAGYAPSVIERLGEGLAG
jgi:mannose-6-phosphate isomerase